VDVNSPFIDADRLVPGLLYLMFASNRRKTEIYESHALQ